LLAGGRIVTAVFDDVAVLVDQLEFDGVPAGRPASQPDRFPLVDESGRAAIDAVTDPVIAALTLQVSVRQPEIDHNRIGIFTFIFTFRTAVGKQRPGWIDVTGLAGRIVFAFAGRRSSRSCRAVRG